MKIRFSYLLFVMMSVACISLCACGLSDRIEEKLRGFLATMQETTESAETSDPVVHNTEEESSVPESSAQESSE